MSLYNRKFFKIKIPIQYYKLFLFQFAKYHRLYNLIDWLLRQKLSDTRVKRRLIYKLIASIREIDLLYSISCRRVFHHFEKKKIGALKARRTKGRQKRNRNVYYMSLQYNWSIEGDDLIARVMIHIHIYYISLGSIACVYSTLIHVCIITITRNMN